MWRPFAYKDESAPHGWAGYDIDLLERMITEIPFEDAIEGASQLLEGKVRGRIVVPVAG